MKLGVIGRGQAAQALVPRWLAAGHTLVFWRTRSDGPIADTPTDPICDAIIIAVSDSAIAEVASQLATRISARNETWLHLSGVHPASILRVSPTSPAHVGGLHPLVALAHEADPAGAIAGLEGDDHSLDLADRLARDLGMAPVHLIGATSRALYHAAAVTVAGQASALFAQGLTLMQAAGLDADTSRRALQPLFLSAAKNLADLSPADALTGPIARGDADTINRHLAAIHALPADLGRPIAAVYRLLASAGLALIEDRLAPDKRDAIARALADATANLKRSSTP